MPTLELAIDARRAEQGAKQAETALRTVSREAANTQAAVGLAGQQINTAFSATSGGLSVTRGIVSTTQALQQGSVAAAGFAASTALLDVSRLANDFSALRASTSGTTSIMGTLASILKTHPLLVIGTAIAAAATAMSLFSGNTKEAATSWETLATSLGKARIDEGTARFLGLSPRSAQQAQLDAVVKLVSEQRSSPTGSSIGQLSESLGVGQSQILARLSQLGNPQANEFINRGYTTFENFRDGGYIRERDLGAVQISAGQLRTLLGDFYRQLVSTQAQSNFPAADLTGVGGVPDYLRAPGGGPVVTGSSVSPYGTGTVLIGESQRSQVELERQTQAADAADARMDDLIEKGREFGATIGDAFFNVASGAQTARQAIAGLVSDLARAASRQAFSNLFGSVVGATATQSRADGGGPGSNIVLPD